jgi:fatty-acid desaturase
MVEGEGVDAYACPDKLGLFGFEEQFRSNTNQSNHSFSLSLLFSLSLTLRCVVLSHTHTHTQHIQNLHREESPYPRPSSFFYSFCGLVRKRAMYVASMRKSFKDSLKLLEADIQHANTLLVLSLSLFNFILHPSIFPIIQLGYI